MSQFRVPEGEVDVLVVAGEHSGDQHAAQMIKELGQGYGVCALGGVQMEKAGAQVLYDLTESSVVGLVEVLKNYSFFKALFDETLRWIEEHRPKVVCLVDYPGFNLRLAKELYRRGLSTNAGGDIKVVYYISPQIWAWKSKRRFELERYCESLAVIFPFEVECFKDTRLPVHFVGHPFVQDGHESKLSYDADGGVLLLPGSRVAPVKRILPVLLKAFRLHRKKYLRARGKIVYASDVIREVIERELEKYGEDVRNCVELVSKEEAVTGAVVLTSSGTMSLNAALAGIPGALVYKAHPVTFWVGRLLVDIDRLGMPNILLDRFIYPEYLQGDAKAKVLSRELEACMNSPERAQRMRADAQQLRGVLSESGQMGPGQWLESCVKNR